MVFFSHGDMNDIDNVADNYKDVKIVFKNLMLLKGLNNLSD